MWIPEQRVVNEAEPDLGIGSIKRIVDHRTIEVHFDGPRVTRTYNSKTAPLRRLVLAAGQQAVGRQGERFKIREVREVGGLLLYLGDPQQQLHERDLASQIPAAHAVDQLLAGQLSEPVDYGLRRDGWKLRCQSLSRETRGLAGARVQLLPHQLYLASRVARQEIPRVLLADEVGLGKTIEAGLIFCTLRALGRANRVLVVTPRTLLHQWLAELFRRFNDMFTVLDGPRCAQLDDGHLSPFQQAPHALCTLEFLSRDTERLKQAAQAGWDLLIIDEAHHLAWDPQRPSRQYRAMERLAARSRGLLLLTATPLRRGYETEFGLLRLVDPERFADYPRFLEEVTHLRRLADIATHLSDGSWDSAAIGDALRHRWPEDKALHQKVSDLQAGRAGAARALLAALIDRHGTGRVLMRNRRSRLHGFPARVLHPVPLPSLEERRPWLLAFLRDVGDAKVLLIAIDADTVVALQDELRKHTTVATALFHDQLSVVERDRQAAWFAEPDGARLLLCSEIGGEGRNFQFAHHLVLWDLPVDPDTLEQRIGRLDRIGQAEDVHLHALYVADAESGAIFAWHAEGLGSFTQPVSGAEQIMLALEDDVRAVQTAYRSVADDRADLLGALLDKTRVTRARIQEEVQANIDLLIDLNSFDAERGERLVAEVRAIDEDPHLPAYLSRLFERFGVTEEELDRRGRRHIRPNDLMFVEAFPGLPQDHGLGATYKRSVALEREDLAFLTRDHPLVEGALGLMLDGNIGRASVCVAADSTERGLVLQFLFVLEASGPARLELARWLPPTPLEVAIDGTGLSVEPVLRRLSEERFGRVGHEGFRRYAGWLHEQFPPLAAAAERLVAEPAEALRATAVEAARAELQAEQERLEALHQVNPTVSEAEVAAHHRRLRRTLAALAGATPRLDAIRLVALTGHGYGHHPPAGADGAQTGWKA